MNNTTKIENTSLKLPDMNGTFFPTRTLFLAGDGETAWVKRIKPSRCVQRFMTIWIMKFP